MSERTEEEIHILLTDVVMPGMHGPVLAQHITRQRPDVRVIFMSGYTSDSMSRDRELPAGFLYVEKPIPTNVLLRTIRAALKG